MKELIKNESLFNALMYLFENHMQKNASIDADPKEVTLEMLRAGFHPQDINKALNWLDDLQTLQNNINKNPTFNQQALRVYHPLELDKLSLEARSYLLFLEQAKIIDGLTREVIIDRVLALDKLSIGEADIKWVTLMILFNHPNRRAELVLLEELILNNPHKKHTLN